MPGSVDRRRDLLANALDGGAGAPEPDDELRRELAVVGLLVAAGRAVEQRGLPDDAARDRMRQRVLAGLTEPAPGRTTHHRFGATGVRGRLLIRAAAALCLVIALSGISLVLARDAVPGDALYGVKRSAESAELKLTFGDEPRGLKHLRFATSRVDEVEALAARSGGSSSAKDAAPYLSTLQSFDIDVAAGSRLLTQTATTGDGTGLASLRVWAEQQRQRLGESIIGVPSPATAKMNGSAALLDRVIERVSALQERLTCADVTSGARDDLGLLPSDGVCVPAAGRSGAPNLPSPGVIPGTDTPSQPGTGSSGGGLPGGSPGPLDPGGGQQPGPATGTPAPDTSTSPTPTTAILPLPLPEITIPPLLPSLPGLGVG